MPYYVAPAGAPEGTITPTGPWSLATLVGSWALERTIDNGVSMNGTASIAARGDRQFDYCEEGRLRLADGRVLEAERHYVFVAENRGFAVFFAEAPPPRLFHRIALDAKGLKLIGDGTHFCGGDRYDSRYEFCPDGTFVIRHAVSGPRKRYTMVTRYARGPAT